MERDVPRATREMPDTRASHFWDGESVLSKGYRNTLGISEDAWDMFILYGPEVKWESADPPVPAYWMHQLGTERKPRVSGPFLNPGTFLQKTRELLASRQTSAAR
jgi:hypothetical protein